MARDLDDPRNPGTRTTDLLSWIAREVAGTPEYQRRVDHVDEMGMGRRELGCLLAPLGDEDLSFRVVIAADEVRANFLVHTDEHCTIAAWLDPRSPPKLRAEVRGESNQQAVIYLSRRLLALADVVIADDRQTITTAPLVEIVVGVVPSQEQFLIDQYAHPQTAPMVTEPVTDTNRSQAMDGPDLTEGEHVVTLNEEVVDVSKHVRAKERVRLETDVETEDVAVDDQIRKERVAMDDEAAPNS